MSQVHRIFLIPGFFGFANFGKLKYFAHVREVLSAAFVDSGHEVTLHYVKTLPTAPLASRAAQVIETMARVEMQPDDIVHLVGHSTGGLDARLCTTPGVSLPTNHDIETWAARVHSVVTVATPHHGTPLARMFNSAIGERALRLLSILTLHTIRLGTTPLPALLALASMLPNLGRLHGPASRILEQLYRQLLRDFDAGRQKELESFFTSASQEQGLITELAPDTMALFNATTREREGVRRGSVVIRGRPPGLGSAAALGISPTAQAMHLLYRVLYKLSSSMPARAFPNLDEKRLAALRRTLGDIPSPMDNDAIVPTRSQVWGDVIHAACADHHDVIGHFSAPEHEPPHTDWLISGSGFARPSFDALWSSVARFQLECRPV